MSETNRKVEDMLRMKILNDKRYSGMIWSIVLGAVFLILSLGGHRFLDGTPWFLYSSILRLIFGFLVLFIMNRLFGKSICEIMSFQNWKNALFSGLGFIIYATYFIALVIIGTKAVIGLSLELIISRLFLQQLTTGFYEELCTRALVIEGYFHQECKSLRAKSFYVIASAIIFGCIHITTGWDTYIFVFTTIVGFSFAVVYIKTRNVVIPMLLHFVYDIFANFTDYVEYSSSAIFNALNTAYYVMVGVMLIVSIFMLVKSEKSA